MNKNDYYKQYNDNPDNKARRKSFRQRPEALANRRSNKRAQWDKKLGFDKGTVEWALAVSSNCALCGESFAGDSSDRGNPLRKVVDHDHATNKFRGIIHQRCNIGIGILLDSEDLCLKAAAYLHSH